MGFWKNIFPSEETCEKIMQQREQMKMGLFKRNKKPDNGAERKERLTRKWDIPCVLLYFALLTVAILGPAILWPLCDSLDSIEIIFLVLLLLLVGAPITFLGTGGLDLRKHRLNRELFNARFLNGRSFKRLKSSLTRKLGQQSATNLNILNDTDVEKFYTDVKGSWYAYWLFASSWIISVFLHVYCLFAAIEHLITPNAITGVLQLDYNSSNFFWSPNVNIEMVVISYFSLLFISLFAILVWFYLLVSASGEDLGMIGVTLRDTLLLSISSSALLAAIFLGFMPSYIIGTLTIATAAVSIAFWIYFGIVAAFVVKDSEDAVNVAAKKAVILEIVRYKNRGEVSNAALTKKYEKVNKGTLVFASINPTGRMNHPLPLGSNSRFQFMARQSQLESKRRETASSDPVREALMKVHPFADRY